MATKSKRKSKSSVVKPEGEYLLTIYMQDKTYSQRTDDIARSIMSLKPEKITNKVRIVLEKGKKRAERMFMVFPARRLFNIPLAAEFFAKNIVLRLK